MKPGQVAWRQEEIERLRWEVQNGKNHAEIARLLGRTRPSVAHKAKQLGLSSSVLWSEADEARLQELVHEGKTHNEIAHLLQRTPQAIQKRCERLGLNTAWGTHLQQQKARRAEGVKLCTQCGEVKPRTHEHFGANKAWCRTCDNAKSREYERASLESLLKSRLRGLAGRSVQHKLACELTLSDLLALWERQAGLCFYSGEPMTINGRKSTNVSIDRIDSAIGYTKENVVLSCWIVNCMKSDLTAQELIEWCGKVSKKWQGDT